MELDSIENIFYQLDPFTKGDKGKLFSRKEDLLYGLAKAIKTNCIILLDENADKINPEFESKEGLIVIENVDNVSGIVAVNYAIAIGADLLVVEAIKEIDEKQIPLKIQDWQSGDSAAYEILKDLVFSRLSNVDLDMFKFVTFFTEGIPYSVVMGNPIPISYVNLQRRPDHFIINSIIAENTKQFGSAVIFSPEKFPTEEVKVLNDKFESQKIYVKKILGKDATSRNLSKSLEFFPYDIYHIVSHGGQVTGSNIEQIFTDSEGNEHIIVYDFILGLAPGKSNEKIETSLIVHPRKLNGMDFHSEETRQKNYPHELFTTMYEAIFDHPKDKIKILQKNKVIVDSAGISCSDFTFHGIIQYLGGEGLPFIFNNTCWSWSKMANSFLDLGCRGYIGTCWNIENSIAVPCATYFYQYGFSMPISQALFIAAKNAEGSKSENIYVFWGLHFSRLHSGSSLDESRANVYQNLEREKEIWIRKMAKKLTDNQKLTIQDAINWLANEIDSNFNEADYEKLLTKFLGQIKLE